MLSDVKDIQQEKSGVSSPVSDHLYSKVIDLSESGMFLVNEKREIVLWNEWMVNASSMSQSEVIGRLFGDVFPELVGRRIESVINTALDKGTASLLSRSLNKTVFPLYCSDNGSEKKRIEQSVIAKPIRSGDSDYCLVQITDVTPMVHREEVLKVLAKEAEEARQAAEGVSRLKSEFTSTVSHELRTPLTSIRGSLGLVSSGVMGALPPEINKLVEIACNNTERLLFLINDILDIEKIESGKMDFVMGPLDLIAVLRQCLEANQPYGEQYNIHYVLKEVAEEAVVYADTDRIMQVLNNLLSNAAKFSPEGAAVEISMLRFDDMIRVNVRDYGAGIPLDFQSRIFEKFSQADASDTRRVGGTGLGLSISRAIMENMAGSIDFETEEGKGTRFFVDIPLYRQ